jgi:hypothetical protein
LQTTTSTVYSLVLVNVRVTVSPGPHLMSVGLIGAEGLALLEQVAEACQPACAVSATAYAGSLAPALDLSQPLVRGAAASVKLKASFTDDGPPVSVKAKEVGSPDGFVTLSTTICTCIPAPARQGAGAG